MANPIPTFVIPRHDVSERGGGVTASATRATAAQGIPAQGIPATSNVPGTGGGTDAGVPPSATGGGGTDGSATPQSVYQRWQEGESVWNAEVAADLADPTRDRSLLDLLRRQTDDLLARYLASGFTRNRVTLGRIYQAKDAVWRANVALGRSPEIVGASKLERDQALQALQPFAPIPSPPAGGSPNDVGAGLPGGMPSPSTAPVRSVFEQALTLAIVTAPAWVTILLLRRRR